MAGISTLEFIPTDSENQLLQTLINYAVNSFSINSPVAEHIGRHDLGELLPKSCVIDGLLRSLAQRGILVTDPTDHSSSSPISYVPENVQRALDSNLGIIS